MGGGAIPAAAVHAPLALLPVRYPRRRFQQAKAAQPLFNALVHAVAADEAYLEATLSQAAQNDDFTARLLALMRATVAARAGRRGSEVALGVHRSDYMLDAPSGRFLQVRGSRRCWHGHELRRLQK